MAALRTVRLGGLDTIIATGRELASLMVDDCLAARGQARLPRLVFSSNGQGISLAGRDPEFARAMQAADIVHADGMPVVLASRWLTRTPLPERIATTDFFHQAAEAAIPHGLRFYMLGATEERNAAVCRAIARLYPDLKIVGRHHGYFPDSDSAAICADIVARGTDVLWVALGKPRQELWSVANRERLRGVGWLKTCGGLYGFLTAEEKRAPRWAQRAGLEWLFRAAQDPRRLGWRYLVTNPHAFYRLLRFSG